MRSQTLLLLILGSVVNFAPVAAAQSTNDKPSALLARQHVFMVDYQGKYLDPAKEWKLDGWTNNCCKKSDDQLALIADGLKAFAKTNHLTSHTHNADGEPRVVVFVHGGLNSYKNGLERLKELRQPMLDSNCYPIFVVWNSDLFSSYAEHLFLIRQGERRPKIGPITSPLVFVADLAKGFIRVPLTLTGRFYNDFQTTELPGSKNVERWEGFESIITNSRPNQVFPPPHEDHARKWPERTRRGVQYTLTTPTKFVALPILDGVGAAAWDLMLRRTRTMFEPPKNYEVTKERLRKWRTHDTRTNSTAYTNVTQWLKGQTFRGYTNMGALHFLSRELWQWSTTGDFGKLPFEFYGHSMGAIVLNEMFRTHPEIRAQRIAYLGAACSIHDFEVSLFPYLRIHTNAHFYNVSLHRIRERDESNLYDLPPRGSLLNWIDDMLARPKNVTDRTLGTWENILCALPDVPLELISRTHFRACKIMPMPFMGDPDKTNPQKHGDFTYFPFWSRQFLWPAIGEPPARLPSASK